MSIILAAATFAFVAELLRNAEPDPNAAKIDRLIQQLAQQDGEIQALRSELSELKRKLSELAAPPPPEPVPLTQAAPPLDQAPPEQSFSLDQFGGMAPPQETEDLTEPMQLAKKRFNDGIVRPKPGVLREILGEPRISYSTACQPVTNPKLVRTLATRNFGNFRLTMIGPALDSLGQVLERLKKEEPDIYAAIGTAGALCARYVRGSAKSVSSHAWGAAVDLTLKRDLDRMGDGSTQFGLVVLAEFFNDAGWYWGAGYSREDSMHFEVGEALLRKWAAEGKL
ncbi:M15 family metallopeptidase [Sinorhizobium fredii]|uniref:M15 family metallopeptidase n=1 Tax=Rhizobium fredii TaxID=380 RepID=UPI00295882CF|nr:M15 family metallopeptidase [Sinorhizobium fredii]WOS66865.1 M15 family metallopeptidase [Sinorhizobium fredii GR64]